MNDCIFCFLGYGCPKKICRSMHDCASYISANTLEGNTIMDFLTNWEDDYPSKGKLKKMIEKYGYRRAKIRLITPNIVTVAIKSRKPIPDTMKAEIRTIKPVSMVVAISRKSLFHVREADTI